MLPNSDSVAKPRATLARLVESAERVIKLGKAIIDAGVAVKMVEQKQRDVEREMTYAIMVGIEALGLGENDKGCALAAMRTWMIREMEAKQVEVTPRAPVSYHSVDPAAYADPISTE